MKNIKKIARTIVSAQRDDLGRLLTSKQLELYKLIDEAVKTNDKIYDILKHIGYLGSSEADLRSYNYVGNKLYQINETLKFFKKERLAGRIPYSDER